MLSYRLSDLNLTENKAVLVHLDVIAGKSTFKDVKFGPLV